VPVAEIAPPTEGLLRPEGGDWSFEEFAGEAGIRFIGLEAASTAASAPGL